MWSAGQAGPARQYPGSAPCLRHQALAFVHTQPRPRGHRSTARRFAQSSMGVPATNEKVHRPVHRGARGCASVPFAFPIILQRDQVLWARTGFPVVRASYNRRGQRACPFDHGHLVAFGIHRSHDAFPHTQRRNERGNLNRSTDVRRRLSQNWRRYQRWGVRRRVRFVGHLTYANAPANSNRVTVAEEVRDPI